jgi:hypothetical protein
VIRGIVGFVLIVAVVFLMWFGLSLGTWQFIVSVIVGFAVYAIFLETGRKDIDV